MPSLGMALPSGRRPAFPRNALEPVLRRLVGSRNRLVSECVIDNTLLESLSSASTAVNRFGLPVWVRCGTGRPAQHEMGRKNRVVLDPFALDGRACGAESEPAEIFH